MSNKKGVTERELLSDIVDLKVTKQQWITANYPVGRIMNSGGR